MKLKDFLAGVLTGVAAGIVVSETIDRCESERRSQILF